MYKLLASAGSHGGCCCCNCSPGLDYDIVHLSPNDDTGNVCGQIRGKLPNPSLGQSFKWHITFLPATSPKIKVLLLGAVLLIVI